MPSCAVPTCKNSAGRVKKKDGITFHMFPTDEIRKAQWTKIIQTSRPEIWKPPKATYICSMHFDEKYFYETKCGFRKLSKDAFPNKSMIVTAEASELFMEISGPQTSKEVRRKTNDENGSTACPGQQEAGICQLEAGISQPKAGRSRQKVGTSQPKAGRRRQEAGTRSQHINVPDTRPPNSSLVTIEIPSEHRALNEAALKITLARIQANPQFYIGIPKNCYHIIDILHKQTHIPTVTILLCLKKVKLDTQFEELADQFGTLPSQASSLFTENLPVIAKSLQSFVTQEKVEKTNKPTSRPEEACVIDALELNVEPNSTKSRELTQTERGNTVKYLIGCGTNGLINYVSPGYGGRQSYETLIEKTNYLERFKPGDSVIVNGFKNVEPIILRKGLKLLRPRRRSVVRVSKNTFLSEQLSDIERVVHRVREFIMVKDQSVISSELVSILDEAVVISCALINLQSFLIN